MRRQFEVLLGILLLANDGLMIAVAFYFAYRLTPRPDPISSSYAPARFLDYLPMLAFTVFTIVVTFFFYRLYHQRRGESRIDEIYRLFPATAIGILGGAALTAIFYQSFDYPRQILVVAFVMTFCLVELGRLVHGTLRAVLFARGRGQLRVLIVGAGEAGTLILGKIRESPRLGYQVVGFLDSGTIGQQIMGIPVIGGLGDLGTVVSNDRIDEVIIALPESSHQELLSIVSQCEDGDVSIKVFPDVFQIMASEVNIGDLSGLPLIAMRDVALRGWRLTLKRIVDLVLSALFLLFASPVMMAIAAAIWLDARGRGPVFFIQERMGLDARPFPMIKFRTMVPYAEMISRWTVNDDPRRTPIGKFLRRHHLDELPQFINVLLGHMSIVGPRAEQRMFVEQFRQMVPRYMERHREKAGITGWAQINGQVGDTSIWERTKYDLYYIENWSLWFDFKIMLLTALRLVRDVNAY